MKRSHSRCISAIRVYYSIVRQLRLAAKPSGPGPPQPRVLLGWPARTRHGAPPHGAFGRPPFLFFSSFAPSVSAQQAHHFPLDPDPVRSEDPRFVGRIRSLQRNRGAPFAQSLERRFLLVDQRDDDLTRLGCVLFANDDSVVLEDAGLDHRIAANLKGEM